MPTAASITVKKADEITNIVYDLVTGAGGDGSPAVWRQDTGANAALPVGLRSTLKCWTVSNGPKTARQTKFNFVMPYALQDSTTTKYSASDRTVAELIITQPNAIPGANQAEANHQFLNLVASTLAKAAADAGYAPT